MQKKTRRGWAIWVATVAEVVSLPKIASFYLTNRKMTTWWNWKMILEDLSIRLSHQHQVSSAFKPSSSTFFPSLALKRKNCYLKPHLGWRVDLVKNLPLHLSTFPTSFLGPRWPQTFIRQLIQQVEWFMNPSSSAVLDKRRWRDWVCGGWGKCWLLPFHVARWWRDRSTRNKEVH